MKTYTVNVHYEMIHTMEVEAENEEQAEKLAAENFCNEENWMDDEMTGITDCCVTNLC